MRRVIALMMAGGLLLAAGCNGEHPIYTSDDRLSNGMVIILPGIEGESSLNHDIRRGLAMSGIQQALPIVSWGRPIPGIGMLLNQMDFIGNRLAGIRIAKMIEQYQDEHPGRPVCVVGHSGGGGVAVFVAEGMSEGRQLDSLVLLSASLWSGYDLTKAMGHCKNGIVNFYNESDIGLLGIGTTLTSNVDGMRGPSVGLIGFKKPKSSDSQEKILAYNKLYEIQITYDMTGGGDPHSAVTRPGFVSRHVAPWVVSSTWPACVAMRPAQVEGLPPKLAKAFDTVPLY